MLELCAKYVNESNSEELVDRLVECVKRGVGMPTRVGYYSVSLYFLIDLLIIALELRSSLRRYPTHIIKQLLHTLLA